MANNIFSCLLGIFLYVTFLYQLVFIEKSYIFRLEIRVAYLLYGNGMEQDEIEVTNFGTDERCDA